MQYLLWICFGVLAVVPWQVIRGQDRPAIPVIEPATADRQPEWDQVSVDEQPTAAVPRSRVSKPDRAVAASRPSLIFRAQGGPPPDGSDGAPEDQGFMASDRITGRSGQALGALFRASAVTGPGIGRTRPIFPIEYMPYAFADNNLFFADIRGFKNSADGYGASFGAGYRRYLPYFDRILGVNAFFDYDNSSGALFRQVGFGVESLGALYDVRANAYLPTGNTQQQLSITNVDGSQAFSGHSLLVDQRRVIANALHGFDVELGVPVPGRIAQRHDVRVFGGGYWFEGVDLAGFGGWKTRIQGNVVPNVALQLEVSNDHQFNTNVVFGATWSYGGFKQPDGEKKTQYGRMTTPVQRLYNMVVGLTEKFDRGVAVVNPETNNPYFFEHVASYATGPLFDGTVEHPFLSVLDAQSAGPHDVIFVHANSTYSGVQVALEENVRVLGEGAGVEHAVNTDGGPLLLPHPTGGLNRPIFANSPDVGVILANNSEFSGFQIGNINTPGSGPTGIGIFGPEVHDVVVRQTDVSFSGGEAVFLRNTSGTISFRGDVINDPVGTATAFHVSGTTGTVEFVSDPSTKALTPTPGVINNVGGLALLVENTAVGSNVDFTGSTVNDNAGNGIRISNDAGTVTLGNMSVTNGLSTGLNILNDTGRVIGVGQMNFSATANDAINIENLSSTGQVSFVQNASVNVTNRLARGINLLDNAGRVSILSPVTIAASGTVPVAAIEYQGSSGNVNFQNITISNGGQGILIGTNAPGVNNSGLFTVRGITQITGGTGNGITITDDDSTVTFNTLTVNNRGRIGVEVDSTRNAVTFTGTSTITNSATAATPFPAIDIRGNAKSITFQNVAITGASGPAPVGFGGVGVNIQNNPGAVNFTTLGINSNSGIGLFANNVGDSTTTTPTGGLIIRSGAISTTNETAIDIQNSVLQAQVTSVSSSNAATNGMRLINNTPFASTISTALNNPTFTVLGNALTGRPSGGTISGAGGAGVVLTNTGVIALGNMNIIQNGSGIVANNTLRVLLNQTSVSTNLTNGFVGHNVQRVDITNSLFNSNGLTTADNQIRLSADQRLPLIGPTNGNYVWNILNNTSANGGFTGAIFSSLTSGDAVVVTNSGLLQDPVSGFVTPVIFNFVNNSLTMQSPGAAGGVHTAGLNVSWIGPESGAINRNQIFLQGDNTGIQLTNTDLDFLTQYQILGNTLTAVFGGNIGLDVNTLGPANLAVGSFTDSQGKVTRNNFNFNTPTTVLQNNSDLGMRFRTGAGSNLDLFSNTITMLAPGSQDQAILFQLLQSPTTVTISDSNIVVNDTPNALLGQGIEFLQTIGQPINLNGALNNRISINGANNQAGPNWVFVSTGASTRGTILVNGFFVP